VYTTATLARSVPRRRFALRRELRAVPAGCWKANYQKENCPMVGRWKEKRVILLLTPTTRNPTTADRQVAPELQPEFVVETRSWWKTDFHRKLPRQ
jgi:hypothetical protein